MSKKILIFFDRNFMILIYFDVSHKTALFELNKLMEFFIFVNLSRLLLLDSWYKYLKWLYSVKIVLFYVLSNIYILFSKSNYILYYHQTIILGYFVISLYHQKYCFRKLVSFILFKKRIQLNDVIYKPTNTN